jgi:hypothetical protein
MYKVTNAGKRAAVLGLCKVAAGSMHTAKKVPFENPCSVDSDTRFPHSSALVVACKADGIRYYCALTMHDNKPIACFVNRTEDVYTVHVRAPRTWFEKGTVYDGELCECTLDASHRVYLVFNVLMHCGTCYFSTPYKTRIAKVSQTIPADTLDTAGHRDVYGSRLLTSLSDEYTIVAKPCVPAAHMLDLLGQKSMYATDGLVFTRLDDSMCAGRAPRLLKWKASHTIDVRFVQDDENSAPCLFAADRGVTVLLSSVIDYTLNETSPLLAMIVKGALLHRRILGLSPLPLDNIVEFSASSETPTQLTYVCVRCDKDEPNDAYTITRTLVAAKSWITPERLARAIGIGETN